MWWFSIKDILKSLEKFCVWYNEGGEVADGFWSVEARVALNIM